MNEEYKEEQEIIDKFIKGDMTPSEFIAMYLKNNRLENLIENKTLIIENSNEMLTYLDSIYGGICRKIFPKIKDEILNYNIYSFYGRSGIYNRVYTIEKTFNHSLKKYMKWSDEFNFSINAIPDYIDGDENIINFISNNIISKLPNDISDSKRIKLCKEEIKKAFYIEGNKYPHWIQSSEWPLSKTGKPTKYIRTENREGGEVKAYIFLDVDTNEEITVEQSY